MHPYTMYFLVSGFFLSILFVRVTCTLKTICYLFVCLFQREGEGREIEISVTVKQQSAASHMPPTEIEPVTQVCALPGELLVIGQCSLTVSPSRVSQLHS